jgi:hypothetical protein
MLRRADEGASPHLVTMALATATLSTWERLT